MTESNDLYIQKISDITRVPFSQVLALRDFGVLDSKSIRDVLIRHDYWTLVKLKKFTDNQIYEKLSGIYRVNKSTIRIAIKNKPRRSHYCRQCGNQVRRSVYIDNNGLCDRCFANMIKT